MASHTITRTGLAWPGIRLNLIGALLLEFSLAECQLGYANFTHAEFSGFADFTRAQFSDRADFGFARFKRAPGTTRFSDVQFTGPADFSAAQLWWADFKRAQFQ